jgi:SGNH domain (fused to AT3 domains)
MLLAVVALLASACGSSHPSVAARSRSTEATAAPAAPGVTTAPAWTAPASSTPAPPPRSGPVTVLVVGDSVADGAALAMTPTSGDYGAKTVDRAVWGCGVVQGGPFRYFGALTSQPPQCDDWPTRWADAVESVHPDVVALIVGRWELMDRVVGGNWSHIGEPAFDDYLRGQLSRAIDVLSGDGAVVAVTTAPYFLRGLRPDGGLYPEDQPERVDRFNALVREVVSTRPGRAAVVDMGARLTPGGFTRVVDGVAVRADDGVHLSSEGGRWLAPWLLGQLVPLAR